MLKVLSAPGSGALSRVKTTGRKAKIVVSGNATPPCYRRSRTSPQRRSPHTCCARLVWCLAPPGAEPHSGGPGAAPVDRSAPRTGVARVRARPAVRGRVDNTASEENLNGTLALAKTAKLFHLPLIVTAAPEDFPAGPPYPELAQVLGDTPVIHRPSLSPWLWPLRSP
ncbi:hypothetical protein [Actinomadura monticuli]|uniref:Uncharacterized protein n=1 Tax=Actinomadura monticuli TaxID=3097367 RepID=A0ABV4Q3T1_9ACTN